MGLRKSCIAIKTLLALAWLLGAWAALAAEVGTVSDISGPLLARGMDGTLRTLALNSAVASGDTLISARDTYARIRFSDHGEITLKPNTQFKIEQFAYDENKPDQDNAIFRLIKGGLRSITGLLGKRNSERFSLVTPTATIGVRGTTFIAQYVAPAGADLAAALFPDAWSDMDLGQPVRLALAELPLSDLGPTLPGARNAMLLAQNTGGGTGGLNPGLYVQVLDGLIHVTNGGGTQNFSAGQFGFTPAFQQPPVILPNNPGLQFNPPPSFSSNTGSQGGNGGGKPGDVDCVVR